MQGGFALPHSWTLAVRLLGVWLLAIRLPRAQRRALRRARADTPVAGVAVVAIIALGGPRPAAWLGFGDAAHAVRRAADVARAPSPRPAPDPARPPAQLATTERRADHRAADHRAADHRAAQRADLQLDAFASDLAATGRAEPARARALASLAVRQARAHGIPPALILGVLLVENEPLDSRAVSPAGARGLMQVHPLWRPLLGPRYGFDLTADSTNLAMGAHILADLLAPARSLADVERGLLRYNGCRRALRAADARRRESRRREGGRAATTPPAPCARYPRLVRRRVEEQAAALCPSRSFARCVIHPLRLASLASAGGGSAGGRSAGGRAAD
jgi:soluble lytic murein transglycosylase-like protein